MGDTDMESAFLLQEAKLVAAAEEVGDLFFLCDFAVFVDYSL
jgi:hypothetical protein